MASAAQAKGRFWGGDNTDSDSDSSSGSEASNKEESKATNAPKVQSRWAVESESESEDENRIARSVKDRTFDGLQSGIRSIANSLKINNWVGIQEGAALPWTAGEGAPCVAAMPSSVASRACLTADCGTRADTKGTRFARLLYTPRRL